MEYANMIVVIDEYFQPYEIPSGYYNDLDSIKEYMGDDFDKFFHRGGETVLYKLVPVVIIKDNTEYKMNTEDE